jgi:protein SCO1/2
MYFRKAVYLLYFFSFFVLLACQGKEINGELYACPMECEGVKTYDHPGTCPVCKMDLMKVSNIESPVLAEGDVPDESIFNLTSIWTTQNDNPIHLADLKGDVLVVVMLYTSCEAACPRLVADMKNIKTNVNDSDVKYVLVSIDPLKDTPERFREYAKEQQLSGDQWVMLQGTVDDVREFSNVLSMKYKKISPIDFSHTNIISVFDKNGVLTYQQEGLGVSYDKITEEVIKQTK